ncbi:Oxygen-insensitive NAD(P)H nitroreductase / Dihydropteridine reductase [hydrothermal vent metagenome]|uniref:Oxygen-insensitive NAD(P)H nitroreductase / Dihydropteridine reductase n=1 Tax=hydrothermal vent metagenome TaxID=652676 RepID=A0A3B1AWZ7_9ZZZZ
MNTFDAVKSRRATKEFDSTHKMPDEDKNQLLSLAMLSPTAFNIQNWRYVVVSDRALRNKIKEAAWGQPQVTDASLLVILCADLKAWEKEPIRYWANASKDVQDFVIPAIEGYYKDKPQVQRDEAMRSCGIAAQTLMLTAKSMGYDSCPMDGFDFAAVAELIQLPSDHVIAMFVAIGKSVKEPWPRPGQLSFSDVVIDNQFNE